MASRTRDAIAWYQKKIGAYDQQTWERSVEQREIKGLRNKPKKSGHVKPDLIDVDLLRGSTFAKAKPESAWTAITRKGIVRVLFFPFFTSWWIQVTSSGIYLWLLVLYIIQVISVCLFMATLAEHVVPSLEVLGTVILMFLLGTVHCQIVSTHFYKAQRPPVTRHRRTRRRCNVPAERHEGGMPDFVCQSGHQQPSSSVPQHQLSNYQAPAAKSKQVFRDSHDISTDDEEPPASNTCGPFPTEGQLSSSLRQRRTHTESKKAKSSTIEESDKSLDSQSPSEMDSDVCFFPGVLQVPSKPTALCSMKPKINETQQAPIWRNCVETDRVTTPAPNDAGGLRHDSESTRHDSEPEDLLWDDLIAAADDVNTTGSSDSEAESAVRHTRRAPHQDPFTQNQLLFPSAHSSGLERVSAIMWEGDECKKAEMSVLEVSGMIMNKVNVYKQSPVYQLLGVVVPALLGLLPVALRFLHSARLDSLSYSTWSQLLSLGLGGSSCAVQIMVLMGCLLRFCLAWIFFFTLCVAERTYKQRYIVAKLFGHLTSARQAFKSEIPHFRLKKLQNIKMWLMLRSYLKRRGPQRSVDVIVSSAFLLALSVIFICCAQLLHGHSTFLDSYYNWELMLWGVSLCVFLLRFITLGSETNKKYSNTSILVTEQMNLYLSMEKKPNKKEELTMVNHVLKLATKLLKELDAPFHLYGLTMNPMLYNITRVVILSAVSGVISDLLGFNLKLWKIKS
uniref:protein PHTF2 isoform X2 n=1 Tax=Myxine glutinosa TaxID=7769 RepID=UPI00358F7856